MAIFESHLAENAGDAAVQCPVTAITNQAEKETIGIIGLGLMGQAFARRLLDAGFHVTGYDLNLEQGRALETLGGEVMGSAAQVAMSAAQIIFSLPDHLVTGRVLESLNSVLKAGHCVIDTTTGSPEGAEIHAASLAARGVVYLDATVSGSSAQVVSGQAVLMVGGTDDGFASARHILSCMGEQAIHTGLPGTGAKMKLVTNLVLGINRAALAEGLSFARALGVEPASALSVLRASMAYSRIMDSKGEKMLHEDFAPQARLSQHLKDVCLMLDATELSLPLTQAHRSLLERAVERGYGALDNSAVIKAYDP